jgi:hypothetical protein
MRESSARVRHRALTSIVLATLIVLAVAPLGNTRHSVKAQPIDTVVLDWNRYAVEVFVNAPTAPTPGMGQTPTVAILHLAIVHGAVYDAVNMIDGGYQPYLSDLPTASASASMAAAVATAAHHTIVGLQIVPSLSPAIVTRLDSHLEDSLAAATNADGASSVAAGIAVGDAASAAMLAERASDGRYSSFSFAVGDEPGEWSPTPPAFLNDPFGWVINVEPFLLDKA